MQTAIIILESDEFVCGAIPSRRRKNVRYRLIQLDDC